MGLSQPGKAGEEPPTMCTNCKIQRASAGHGYVRKMARHYFRTCRMCNSKGAPNYAENQRNLFLSTERGESKFLLDFPDV